MNIHAVNAMLQENFIKKTKDMCVIIPRLINACFMHVLYCSTEKLALGI